MNLDYSARKRLSRIVDHHAREAEQEVLEGEHGEALATIAGNAVHDRLLEDEDLGQLVALASGAEDLVESRDLSTATSDTVENAWFDIEDAIEEHAERRREKIVADVLEREVISA